MAETPRRRIPARDAALKDPAVPAPNAVTAGRPEEAPARRTRTDRAASPQADPLESRVSLNSIVPGRERVRATRVETPAATGAADESVAVTARDSMPEHVRQRFERLGNKYYFPSGDPAFRDHGTKLTTRSENTELIGSLIDIAQARGWESIQVRGTDRFRQEAWRQARLAGLEVRGYRATAQDQKEVIQTLARERRAGQGMNRAAGDDPEFHASSAAGAPLTAGPPKEAVAPDEARILRGRLLQHGPANYRFNEHTEPSYFVRVQTPTGTRDLWGKDFERAIRESLSSVKPGDDVTIRHVGEQAVTVPVRTLDEAGRVVRTQEISTVRNAWRIERQDFLAERAKIANVVRDPTVDAKQATREHPSLAGTYIALKAAELAARKAFADERDRQRFTELTRHALADQIASGQSFAPVRVRQTPRPDRARDLAPQERSQGRSLS